MATELHAFASCSLSGGVLVYTRGHVALSASVSCSLTGAGVVHGRQPVVLIQTANCSLAGSSTVTSASPTVDIVLSGYANCSLASGVNISLRQAMSLNAYAKASLSGEVIVSSVPQQELHGRVSTSLAGMAYIPVSIVLLKATVNTSLAGDIAGLECRNPNDPEDPYDTGYPHLLPQPAIDPWNWLACKTGFGSTFEGFANLNLTDGTEGSALKEDAQRGIRQTHFRQWNLAWLAVQETPPSYDPTDAAKLQRLAAVLGMQEQLEDTVLDADALHEAMVDADGNSLGWLYFWDLQRTTGDDEDGMAALHVGYVSGLGLNMATVLQTVNCYWSCQGRAHGIAYQDGAFIRGDGGSYDGTEGQAVFYRKALDGNGDPTGEWVACGSMTPDAAGRWSSPPVSENGYVYGVRATAGDTVATSVDGLVTREYSSLVAWFSGGCSYPAMDIEACRGTVHLVYIKDGAVRYTQSCPYLDDTTKFPGFRYGNLAPIDGTVQSIAVLEGAWSHPSVVTMPTRDVYVSAVDTATSTVKLMRSQDQGATWEAVTIGTFTTGLTQCSLTQRRGVLSLAGVASGQAVYRRSDDGGVTAAKLAGGGVGASLGGGTVTSKDICAASDEQPDIVIDPTGAVYVACNTGSAIAVMVSRDGGNTWSEAQVIA